MTINFQDESESEDLLRKGQAKAVAAANEAAKNGKERHPLYAAHPERIMEKNKDGDRRVHFSSSVHVVGREERRVPLLRERSPPPHGEVEFSLGEGESSDSSNSKEGDIESTEASLGGQKSNKVNEI